MYEAVIELGRETDTDDLHGTITREAHAPDDESISRAIKQLTGPLMQMPPAYSAKRVAGRRAYDAARAGVLEPFGPR